MVENKNLNTDKDACGERCGERCNERCDNSCDKRGLVSVIMPNFNGGKYLRESVDSVLSQTYTYWELIFVDDCSSDDSLDIVRSYDDERIKILQNKQNCGAAESRNYALREARGRWVAFLDSDDIWLPEKLEKQIDFMVEKSYYFSYTRYSHIGEDSRPLGVEVTGPRKIGRIKMLCYDYMGCLTVMYDACRVGLIQAEPSLRSRNDYAMWLKASRKCDCYLLDENLAAYRVRKSSLSHSGLRRRIYDQYRLFRVGEGMGAVRAFFHTLVNMFFGVMKKTIFHKSVKTEI